MAKQLYLLSDPSGSTILFICDLRVLVKSECGFEITGCGRSYKVNNFTSAIQAAYTDAVVRLLKVVI